jgi:predicted adenylyl cyclase CyaB
MREVELKSVLLNWGATRARLEDEGARLVFAGRLEDRRFDSPDRALATRDVVLRLRVHRGQGVSWAELHWKGPTEADRIYKVRDELQVGLDEAESMAAILEGLGYIVTLAIDREVEQYELEQATVRLERYPRMDDLIEVEGNPDAIEQAIARLGLPRDQFTSERLPEFILRFQSRTGQQAALSASELAGTVRYALDDA